MVMLKKVDYLLIDAPKQNIMEFLSSLWEWFGVFKIQPRDGIEFYGCIITRSNYVSATMSMTEYIPRLNSITLSIHRWHEVDYNSKEAETVDFCKLVGTMMYIVYSVHLQATYATSSLQQQIADLSM